MAGGHDRRSVLRGAAQLGAATALFGMGGAFAPPAQAQTVMTSLRSTAKSWLWMPEDFAAGSGLFEKAGIKVTGASTERGVNVDALLSGATNVLLGAPTQTMRVQIKGQPVKLIAGFVNKYASNIVVKKAILDKAGVSEASPVEKKIAVLKGLKLGTTGPGAAPDSLFRYFMAQGKINPDTEAELVTIRSGGAGMLAALEKNAIDGFCLSSPTSDLAVRKFGAAYLFNMSVNPPAELRDYLYIGVSVTNKFAAEQPAQLTAYCKGIALGLKAMQESPDRFRDWSAKFFDDLPADLFPDAYANNRDIYMKTPMVTEDQFKLNVKFLDGELRQMGESGIPASFKFSDAYDMRFVAEALKSL